MLIQDRIDIGLAQVVYALVVLLGQHKRRPQFRDFLPEYLRDMTQPASSMDPAELENFFERLSHADDQHADGRRPVPDI